MWRSSDSRHETPTAAVRSTHQQGPPCRGPPDPSCAKFQGIAMRALLMHSCRSQPQLQRGEVEPDRAKNKGGRVKGTFSRTGAPWMSCIRVCTFSPAGSFRLQLKSCLFLNPGGQHTAGQANPGCPASGFVPTVLQAALSLQGSPAYLNPGGEIPPKCQPI